MGDNPEKPEIRLVIADDHRMVREGLASLLSDEPDLKVVGQADDGAAAVGLVETHQPDLVLLDIAMPEMTGLEAAREISRRWPQIKILMLTMHEEKAFFFEALRAGAHGYILKGARSGRLVDAIRAVCAGGVYLSPEVAGSLVQEYVQKTPETQVEEMLTPRETEILRLIARGMTNTEIADALTLSVNTVKTHRLHIYQKLELSNQAELVAYALLHGLLK